MNLPATTPSNSYEQITARVESYSAITKRDSEIFHKSSSQFKTVTLDVTDITASETAKHLLASITHTRAALEEASIAVKRKQLDVKRKEQELLGASGFDAEALIIDIDELTGQLLRTEASARGAIRKLSFLTTQYDAIVELIGHQTEEQYEIDQTRHHVMTAFLQALAAARAHGGVIDEGNHIYLFQLGINGSTAQQHVTDLLNEERELLNSKKAPTHDMVISWLHSLADMYAGNSLVFARARGLVPLDYSSMLELNQ